MRQADLIEPEMTGLRSGWTRLTEVEVKDLATRVGAEDPFSGTGMATWARDTMSPHWLGKAVTKAGVARGKASIKASILSTFLFFANTKVSFYNETFQYPQSYRIR